ncbi:hypothetical protein T484DRAFT_3377942 [Baffinella frigidus]|nr:hypothetical protein T484DRAFT_3377942 [Cryptophyta sp. CCMP2293]
MDLLWREGLAVGGLSGLVVLGSGLLCDLSGFWVQGSWATFPKPQKGLWGLGVWNVGRLGLRVWALWLWRLGVWSLGRWGLGVWSLGRWGLGVWNVGRWGLGVWSLGRWGLWVWTSYGEGGALEEGLVEAEQPLAVDVPCEEREGGRETVVTNGDPCVCEIERERECVEGERETVVTEGDPCVCVK